jgi:sugar phosphate isomerase/epimerase
MKIGISRISEGPQQAAELIQSAAANGFDGIQFKTAQLRAWDFDPQTLLAIDPRAKALAAAGVVYHPGGDYAKWAEPTRQVLGFVRALGGEHVCYCFSPAGPAEVVAGQLAETGRAYAEAGVSFSFHDHADTIVGTLDDVRRMCDLVDPAVCGLTFDTAHAAACGMDDLGGAIRALASHVTNVHLKDIDEAGAFCPLGKGRLDLQSAVETLRDIGYRHWLIVDEESRDYTTPEACALSAKFLRGRGLMA